MNDLTISGYEIHVGRTEVDHPSFPLLHLHRQPDGETLFDGTIAPCGRIAGTYVHGLLAADDTRHALIQAARTACGLAPASELADVASRRAERLDRLAAHVRKAVDIGALLPA
jgi:adenosylcobyric acid synthase